MCTNLALSADLLTWSEDSPLMENLFQKIVFCGVLVNKNNIAFMEPIIAEKIIVIFALVF